MPGYLSLDIICSSWLTVFLEICSRKTVRFSEQKMSADKYPSMCSRQMATIVYIFLSFQMCTRCETDLKDNKHNSLHLGRKYISNSRHLARKYARIFVRGHCLFREANSFPRANVSYEEQIMSKDKYPSIFSPQMEAIVFIVLQIFFATRAILAGEYSVTLRA